MPSARSRFSHRHLLALSTFLVPLAVLAVLGWNELQRSGATAQAAMTGEAREFVKRASQAVDQRIKQAIRRLFSDEAVAVVENEMPVRATLDLRKQLDMPALCGIVMLRSDGGVARPSLPVFDPSLPGLDRNSLAAAQSHSLNSLERFPASGAILQQAAAAMAAQPPGQRVGVENESMIRRQLAAWLKANGDIAGAKAQWQAITRLQPTRFSEQRLRMNQLQAEEELVKLAGPAEKLEFLRALGSDGYSMHPDGLLSAHFDRVAATFAADDHANQAKIDRLYEEDVCRTAIRRFATDYEIHLKGLVMLRRRSHAGSADAPGGDPDDAVDLVARIGQQTALVAIRLASEKLSASVPCTHMAVHVDLDVLLAPVWQQFANDSSTFVLGVLAAESTPIVPLASPLPADAAMASETTYELTLLAYPADPARLQAEADAGKSQRTLLILVLFVTALGGALWSWRSVSREAELAAMKVDLVSRVSHELKTPLALVRMYGETLGLGRARDAAQVSEFGGIIAREAERLTALIQRILDFSKQQAGTLNYAPEPIDLTGLLRNVVETYSPHLEARGCLLIDSLRHGVRVHCDANACESAIVNLLENAAKYGRDGDVEHEIELDLLTIGDRAVIEVRDRGRGIPAAELTRIFDGFYRATNAGEVRGAGLGLSLVRHFARAHGGDIEALPRDGGGTVMRLWLPLAAAGDAAATPTPPTNQHAGPSPAADS